MNILVTGGAGYIGSHAVLHLLGEGHAVTVVDDLSRGNPEALAALESLGSLQFIRADLNDRERLIEVMRERAIDTIMHFAALAYVGESVEQPLRYYRTYAAGTLALLEAVDECAVSRFIFSSSCAVYGVPDQQHVPINEHCPQDPINPYGRSKRIGEQMLFDYAATRRQNDNDFACVALRYFNIAGSDQSGRLGEDHKPETHLIPICLEAALAQRENVVIYGTDYPTPDGTCIRDYVHVDDLAAAHVTVMNALKAGDQRAYNVGIGTGYSVRQVIDACQRVTGIEFPVREGERRPGDPPVLYNDPTKIQVELGWAAKQTDLDAIIQTAWQWKRTHPHGYTG